MEGNTFNLPVPADFEPSQERYVKGTGLSPPLNITLISFFMKNIILKIKSKFNKSSSIGDFQMIDIIKEGKLIYNLYKILEYKLVYNEAVKVLNQYKQDIKDIEKIYESDGSYNSFKGYGNKFRELEIMKIESILQSCEAGIIVYSEDIEYQRKTFFPAMEELYKAIISLTPKDGIDATPFNFKERKDLMIPKLYELFGLTNVTEKSLNHNTNYKAIQRFISTHLNWGGPGSYMTGGKRRNKTRRYRFSRKKN
jgi:hypothetical protein